MQIYTFFFISLPNQAGEELKTHKQKKRLLATQNEHKYGLALTTL